MHTKRCHIFGTALAIAIASSSLPARAIDDSTRSAARALVNEGAEYFKQGRYVQARRKFLDAYEVAKVPTVAVWAAQANEKLGKLVAASELYEAALLMQPNELWIGNTQQQAQEQALQELRILRPRIPTLKINLEGASASEVEVTIDNSTLPSALLKADRPTDPGTHVITATRGGNIAAETVITLAEAERKVVTLQLPAAGNAAPPLAPVPSQTAGIGSPPAPATALSGPTNSNLPQSTTSPLPRLPPQGAGTQSAATGAPTETFSAATRRTIGWIGLGVGAAGVALGTTAGVIVGLKRGSLHSDGCNSNECPDSSYQERVDSYNSWRTISTVAFVVGGVGAAAGITLLLTSPKQEPVPNVGLQVGPSTVSLKGAF
jgi:hypothetical protein